MTDKVVLYSHPECTYSGALKEELDEAGVVYKEIDLSVQPEEWGALESLTGGERITPVLIEGEAVTVGFHGVG